MIVRTTRRSALRTREAFTLLEVLVVVAILVVLASVAGIYVFKYYEDAKADATVLKMQQLENACKAYAAKNDGNWPQSLQELVQPSQTSPDPYIEGGPAAILSSWNTPINYTISQGPGGEQAPVFQAQSSDGRRVAIWPVWARQGH
jgi:general secretion pathway protein G